MKKRATKQRLLTFHTQVVKGKQNKVKNNKNNNNTAITTTTNTTNKRVLFWQFRVCRMPVVLLLLFQVVAGIALFIFLLRYLSYIFNAIVRDFCETLITTKEFLQQLQDAYANSAPDTDYLHVQHTTSPASSSSPSSLLQAVDKRNFSKIPIKVHKMQTSDDAKFIKKWVCNNKRNEKNLYK